MARRYEYIIHGPPLSPPPSSQTTSPKRTLHSRRDSQKVTNLRSLYRNSASPTQLNETYKTSQDQRIPSPTTPNLPPTPPVGDEHDSPHQQSPLDGGFEPGEQMSVPTTPVNQHSPPTPDDTPPRNTLKAPLVPSLAMRPSMASTRAESFRTAHENLYSDDDLARSPPPSRYAVHGSDSVVELSPLVHQVPNEPPETFTQDNVKTPQDQVEPESVPLPPEIDGELSDQAERDTPQTQFHFDHMNGRSSFRSVEMTDTGRGQQEELLDSTDKWPSIHEQVTTSNIDDIPKREKSLRDRLDENKQLNSTTSTEAFANVIGWNDGTVIEARTGSEDRSNRWSGNSNPSAVEAYVVDSPIKPRKRGTLRKVVKNDSLRVASSPLPDAKRASLQSNSDSSHRLVHKKAILTNQTRWSTGSDISKGSLGLNHNVAAPKPEVIEVAIVPKRTSSLQTSTDSSRRHSRSMSVGSGHTRSLMPPVSTPVPRRKRAFSESTERTPQGSRPPQVPIRRSSLSAPTSRSASRANSIGSEQFSLQRQQAEKDLRTTLDRMESERLSASLRRGSDQSSSPTPAPKPIGEGVGLKPNDAQISPRLSSTAPSAKSDRRPSAIGINGITPGSKEWAELRPSTVAGTPFSQTSMMSTSPEIIEAKVVSFFPHHNESLQLIEPNRLSESQAVRALKERPLGRSNTEPSVKITTPRTSDHLIQPEIVDSPLRNPRKPPEPPQFEVIPPTPLSELNKQLGTTPHHNSIKPRTGTVVIRKRPSLQDRERSESFLKQLTRNFSTRNAKNPKADQDIDGTLHPFWRPRAFWDENGNVQKASQEPVGEQAEFNAQKTIDDRGVVRNVTILAPAMPRSNTIATGPVSLMRKISERKKHKRAIDDHIVQHQALVKQTSYSSLQRFKAGRRMYGLPPIRSLSLNMGMGRLKGLQDRMIAVRTRREDERREKRREALRKSIGTEVISQGDSRFIIDRSMTRRVDPTEQLLRQAQAQELAQRGSVEA